ncbi:MAG TPA: type II toxin-antitoxin system HipA family toxin [Humibacter sp.]|nr:type II toxin-antitoxin system HipA family toxin [Humibacter sp.]
MTDRLTAYLGGTRIGWFTQTGSGITFRFDDAWRAVAQRAELSQSMPKSRRDHTGSAPVNFLWNLLPDNTAVLERWGSRFGVSARNPMALLEHVGLDAAGAIQLTSRDEPRLEGPSRREPITDAEIAAHLRELRVDPDAWLIPGYTRGRFSLAGAQPKFALSKTETGWAVPSGRAASTHIVKPGIRGLDLSALNEHLSLRAASLLGIDAATTQIVAFEDQIAIASERFDRTVGPRNVIARVHQEDLAQATGRHPANKYQNEGGPGIREIADVLRATRGRDVESSVQRFFEAALFNWVMLGTDAHSKNYALLHDQSRGPRLAPLYDVASALPYPDLNDRRARLSMSFGGHYRPAEISRRHIEAEASGAGLDPEWAIARAGELVDGIAHAYDQAAREAELKGADAAFAARMVDNADAHAQRLRSELDRTTGSRRAQPSAAVPTTAAQPSATQRRTSQPRNKDVGGTGNPGSFAAKRSRGGRTS